MRNLYKIIVSITLLLTSCFTINIASAQEEAEVKLFAHRGGAYEIDENTLGGFRRVK